MSSRATCEKKRDQAIRVNNNSFLNACKVAQEFHSRIFVPSSISAYGFESERDRKFVHDKTYQTPTYLYGITKVFMELMGNYYSVRDGLDFRCIRYPGIVSPIVPHGGTTDFAIRELTRHGLRGGQGEPVRVLPQARHSPPLRPRRRHDQRDRILTS